MGYSTWSQDNYTAYAASTNLRSLSREQTFTSRQLKDSLNPAKFEIRESRDSSFNPQSTPIIFALDVTGSMGYLAENIAKVSLPKLMESIYDKKPVTDPHVMFMGIGDVNASDRAPLQMSQFEADIRIVEQLREMWLEGGGGGNDTESYNLPWYAAYFNTVTDASEKGRRGFLFTIGDEHPPEDISQSNLERVFGSRGRDLPLPANNHEMLDKVNEKYATFHIVVEEGNYVRWANGTVQERWTELMGPNVLFLKDHKYLSELVTATMLIENGGDIMEVCREISNRGNCPVDILTHAFKNALKFR